MGVPRTTLAGTGDTDVASVSADEALFGLSGGDMRIIGVGASVLAA
jgi:hypothetical protein